MSSACIWERAREAGSTVTSLLRGGAGLAAGAGPGLEELVGALLGVGDRCWRGGDSCHTAVTRVWSQAPRPTRGRPNQAMRGLDPGPTEASGRLAGARAGGTPRGATCDRSGERRRGRRFRRVRGGGAGLRSEARGQHELERNGSAQPGQIKRFGCIQPVGNPCRPGSAAKAGPDQVPRQDHVRFQFKRLAVCGVTPGFCSA